MTNTLTNKDYKRQVLQLKIDNAELTKRLDKYTTGGATQISEEEVTEVKVDYMKYLKHWRIRRRDCLEIVDAICEGVNQKRS